MTAHTRNALLPVLSLIGLTAPLGAVADVTVQEQTTVNVSNLKAHSLTTRRISGDKERSETEDRNVDIVRLDRGVTWSVDPKKKRYTETPFPTAQQRQAAESCPVPRQAPAIDTAKCELTPPKLTVDKTDEAAPFAGYNAQRTNLKLIQNCKSQDPSQACQLTYSFDVWLTLDRVPGGEDESAFRRRALTQLGVGPSSVATSATVRPYLAPFAGAMQQLAEKSNELKGYPLKTTFRVGFSGVLCGGAGASRTASMAPGAVSDAASAATAATASSAEHAAGWGTADAVARSTGSSVGGYVAGSAAGAFTGRLIGGLFAKKPKPDPKPASTVTESVPVTILAEVTTETTSLSADTIPAAQFEPPPGWTKLAANPNGDPLACHPRN